MTRHRIALRGQPGVSYTDGPEARDEVKDGVIDELLSELKTTAFRRPEGHVCTQQRYI